MPKLNDLVGIKFGYLVVLAETDERRGGQKVWLCECKCGRKHKVATGNLQSNNTKSCGCIKSEARKGKSLKHGLSSHPLYQVWASLKDRCLNNNHMYYKNYGGRGIRICDEWANDFKAFYDWAIKTGYQHGLQIDRIDNDGNYEMSNCRWVSRQEQCNNTRCNKIVVLNGITDTLVNHCRRLNQKYGAVKARINIYGWSVEKALTQPVRRWSRKR